MGEDETGTLNGTKDNSTRTLAPVPEMGLAALGVSVDLHCGVVTPSRSIFHKKIRIESDFG